MDPLSSIGLALAIAAVVAVVVTAIRARRLQGRIHRRLLVLAILPALAVAAVSLWGYSSVLRLLEAPGLEEPAEGGLVLARHVLAQERARAEEDLDGWLASAPPAREGWRPPPPPRGSRLRVMLADTGEQLWSAGTAAVSERIQVARPLDFGGRAAEIQLLRPLDEPLAGAVGQIDTGTRGLAQLRLYYGELLRRQGLWLLGVLLLLVVGVSLWISRRLAQGLAAPLTELSRAAGRVAAGEREIELPAAGDDELGDLVRAFDRMTGDLVAGEERLRRSERLAAWRDVARRLAHEIKNPLTPIHLAAHRMRRRSEDPAVHEGLETILEETVHLQRLADEFSAFARLPRPRPSSVELRPLLEQVISLYAQDYETRWEGGTEPVFLQADEGQLRRVLSNLVKNAVEASPRGSTLSLRLDLDGSRAVLEIEDEGEGLPPDAHRLFEPDFTTRGAGTGLGLPICRRIVEDHGGRIEARPGRVGGACLRVEWPRAQEGEA